MTAPARVLLWAGGAGVLTLLGTAVPSSPFTTYGGAFPLLLWLQFAATAGLLVVASLAGDPARRVPLTLAAVTWPVPELAGWTAAPAEVRTLADAWARVLPAVLLLGVMSPHPGPADRLLARIAAAGAAVAAVARLFLVDPFRVVECWRTCAANPLLLGGGDPAGRWIETGGLLLTAAGTGGYVIRRLWLTRRRPAASTAKSLAVAALLMGQVVPGLLRPAVPESPASVVYLATFVLAQTGAVLLAGTVVRDRVVQWRLGWRLTRLAGSVTTSPPPGALAAVLRRAVQDPSLAVLYHAPDRGSYVDAEGRPAHLPPPDSGRRVTAVARRGRPVAAIVHEAHVDGQNLERALGAALRLALQNEQLRAAALAELAELRLSRARIVERATVERRRLERNLHDGAQQRIVSLALMIRMLADRAGDGAGAAPARRAQTLVRITVEELRRVARGIYPAVLADAGLAGAVEELAESSSDLVVRVDGVPAGPCPGPVETTAYLVVAGAVADARARRATVLTVCGTREDGRLVVEVRHDAAPPPASAMQDVRDQVSALSGVLQLEPCAEGTRVRLELPCGS